MKKKKKQITKTTKTNINGKEILSRKVQDTIIDNMLDFNLSDPPSTNYIPS